MASSWVGLLVGTALMIGTPAVACREYVFPEHLEGHVDAAIVVRVTSSGFAGDQSRFYTWRAQAKYERTLKGAVSQQDFEFGGAWQSSGCSRTKPPPAAGELWVIYLRRSGDRWVVGESYPLDIARKIDPDLRGDEATAASVRCAVRPRPLYAADLPTGNDP